MCLLPLLKMTLREAQIHKCQGLTLDLARVSLRSMFAEGQAYVALSRARCLEGLQVLEYSQSCVKARAQLHASYATPHNPMLATYCTRPVRLAGLAAVPAGAPGS